MWATLQLQVRRCTWHANCTVASNKRDSREYSIFHNCWVCFGWCRFGLDVIASTYSFRMRSAWHRIHQPPHTYIQIPQFHSFSCLGFCLRLQSSIENNIERHAVHRSVACLAAHAIPSGRGQVYKCRK